MSILRSVLLGCATITLALATAQAAEPEDAGAGGGDGGAKAGEGKPPAKPSIAATKEYQLEVWKIVMGSSREIDACTSRYTGEFPDRKGEAKLSFEMNPQGLLAKYDVKCTMQASQVLVVCLKDVVRKWRFPAPYGDQNIGSNMSVQIAKGVNFVLLKPGEKPPEAKPNEPQPEGFLNLLPQMTPSWETGK